MYDNLYNSQEISTLGEMDKQFLLAASLLASNIEGDYMEIGSWAGGSAVLLCTYMPNDKILHAIDCDPQPTFKSNIIEYGCQNKINFIHDTFQNYFQDIPENLKLALLFIDAGDHNSEDSELILKTLWPFVSKGGLVIFHDYDGITPRWDEESKEEKPIGYPEVRDYVDKIVAENNEESFVNNGQMELRMNIIGTVGDVCFAIQKM